MWGHLYYSYSHSERTSHDYGIRQRTVWCSNHSFSRSALLFFVFAFLRSPGTIPHRLPNRPPINYTPPLWSSEALREILSRFRVRGVTAIRLMPKTAPRRSQRVILLLSHTICITIVFSSTRMPMNALKPSTSSSMPGKCFDMAKSISSYTAI